MAASEILIRDRIISVHVMSDVPEVTCKQTTESRVMVVWEGRNEFGGMNEWERVDGDWLLKTHQPC